MRFFLRHVSYCTLSDSGMAFSLNLTPANLCTKNLGSGIQSLFRRGNAANHLVPKRANYLVLVLVFNYGVQCNWLSVLPCYYYLLLSS